MRKPTSPPHLVVGLTTFDRPDQYRSTLEAIREATGAHRTTVVAVQDGGAPYVSPVEGDGFKVIPVHKHNDGKTGYWMTINAGLQAARGLKGDFYLQLPDDAAYRRGWLTKAMDTMDLVGTKSAVNLMACHRAYTGTWGILPRAYREGLLANGFLDGAFITTKRVMDLLGWTVLPIPAHRWNGDSKLGSGVWAQVTRRLLRKGVKIYNLTEAWLTTDWSGENSKMNANRETA